MTYTRYTDERWPSYREAYPDRRLLTAHTRAENQYEVTRQGVGSIFDAICFLLFGRRASARRLLEYGMRWIHGDPERFGPLPVSGTLPHTPTQRREVPPEELPPGLGEPGVDYVAHDVQLGWSDFQEYDRQEVIGIGRWLLDDIHDESAWNTASDCLMRFYTDHPKQVDRGSADCCLRVFEHAGRHELIDQYLAQWGQRLKFKPPASPARVRTERALAWVWSKHDTEGRWTPEQVADAATRLLFLKMDTWFADGAYHIIATWMKRMYGQPGDADRDTPEVALRNCADYLPEPFEFPLLRDE